MDMAAIKIKQTNTTPLVVGDKVFRSAYDYELSNEDVEQARKQLGETENVRNTSLQKLKEMLSKDNVKFRTDDDYLLQFLRLMKFNYKAAYEKILLICKNRKEYSEVFCTLPSNFEELLNRNIFIYLPYRDQDGSIILMQKISRWNVDELPTFYNLLQLFQPIADLMTMNPSCQINRIIYIVDCEGVNKRHFTTILNPLNIWHVMSACQNMYPWRLKYVFLLNCNNLVYAAVKTIRVFLKKRIADRIIIVDSDWSKLHEYVDPAILPKEYGGNLKESECAFHEHIMNNMDYIKYELSFGKI